MYADFETYQEPRTEVFGEKAQQTSFMTGVSCYAYMIVSRVPSIESKLVYKLGTADDFVEEIDELTKVYKQAVKT